VLLGNIHEQSDAERIVIGEKGTKIIKKIFMRYGLKEEDLSYENLKKEAKKYEETKWKVLGSKDAQEALIGLQISSPEVFSTALKTLYKKIQIKTKASERKKPRDH
ncbi:MAG: hypothetical protein KAT94_02685, partial [Candidatus Aenigmarchaeota archaeon]|nr:hypothetical protein [Candidatus Aenigmarchaeota archaeon]